MPATLSQFARGLSAETAFDVLAVAKRLKAAGKDVIELQIGDSPFPSTKSALAAGVEAIRGGVGGRGQPADLAHHGGKGGRGHEASPPRAAPP